MKSEQTETCQELTVEDIARYMLLAERKAYILMHSGISWKPEYGPELEAIDKELASLRVLVGQALEQKKQPAQSAAAEGTVEMVTLREAASRTGISYDRLRKMCINGQIVHIKAGCKFLINWEKLVDYLNAGEMGNNDGMHTE